MTNTTSTALITTDDANPAARDAFLLGDRALAVRILCNEGMALSHAIRATSERRMPQVGDILTASWGYDQTNVDFYEVVAVTKASVKIREIRGKIASSTGTQDVVVPAPGNYAVGYHGEASKILTKRFRLDGWGEGVYCCRIDDCSTAHLWDGEPERQTAANCGH